MFTPDKLMDMSIEYGFAAEKARADHNQEVHMRLRRLRDDALFCSTWMEKEGISELKHVGPFTSFDISPGDRVRIRRGALISSTHPRCKAAKPSGRA